MTTTSGQYAWNPALSDLIIAAYGRCQIRRSAITVEHLQDAATAANLLQVDWANEQVNLWTVELATMPLIQGQTTYDVDPTTIMIMAAYITTGEADVTCDDSNYDIDENIYTCDVTQTPAQDDRILTSVDRDTYARFPDKTTPGRPTVYWFNKQLQPSITLWQPPESSQRYTLHYFRARQMQDASATGEVLADVPYSFLEAYVASLAFKLAETWAPARMAQLEARALNSFTRAARRNVEDAPLRVIPALGTYTDAVY